MSRNAHKLGSLKQFGKAHFAARRFDAAAAAYQEAAALEDLMLAEAARLARDAGATEVIGSKWPGFDQEAAGG